MKRRTKISLLMVLLVFSVFSVTYDNDLYVMNGDQVTVKYDGWIDNYTFDSMIVTFTVGQGEVIPGLDSGVIGMKLGDVKNITIPPELAFGEYNMSHLYELKLEFFEVMNESIPFEGEFLTINGARGKVLLVTNQSVIFDTNHELAGETVNMTVNLMGHSRG